MPGMTVANVREMEAMVDKARVVGVTCLGITHAMFGKRKFDVCIVDEAGQITLPVRKEPMFIIHMNYHPEEKATYRTSFFVYAQSWPNVMDFLCFCVCRICQSSCTPVEICVVGIVFVNSAKSV
jgi:hypothetical protein